MKPPHRPNPHLAAKLAPAWRLAVILALELAGTAAAQSVPPADAQTRADVGTPGTKSADGAAPAAAAAPGATAPPGDTTPAARAPAPDSYDPSDDTETPLLPGGRVAPPPTAADRAAQALRKELPAYALRITDDYLAQHPRDAQMRFLRAVALGDLKRNDEAAKALEALIEDFPELAEPYNNLATIRAGQGELYTAEHYLLQAVAADPNYLTARENLGDLYIAMAAAAYDQALRRKPDSAGLRKKLAQTRELGAQLHAWR